MYDDDSADRCAFTINLNGRRRIMAGSLVTLKKPCPVNQKGWPFGSFPFAINKNGVRLYRISFEFIERKTFSIIYIYIVYYGRKIYFADLSCFILFGWLIGNVQRSTEQEIFHYRTTHLFRIWGYNIKLICMVIYEKYIIFNRFT